MTITFITRGAGSRLLLIFTGWSTDHRLFSKLRVTGWDVAVVSGDSIDAPDFSPLDDYPTIYLFAWSMGVYFAERMLPARISPAACYAINGTPFPCHDTQGIPEAVFIGTARALNPRNLRKFRIRMCGSSAHYLEHERELEGGDAVSLAALLLDVAAAPLHEVRLPWQAAYVGLDDRIFPPANQMTAWGNMGVETRTLHAPHMPDIVEIIRSVVIDVATVEHRFSRSLGTYTAHAHAQRMIARRLAEQLAEMVHGTRIERLIEIGSGTGLFTREWSSRLSVGHAIYLDLCEMPRYAAATTEEYVKGDAELYVEEMAKHCRSTVDAIVSASAIQWFSNPKRFLSNCHQLLRPGGILAVSTFAPGNLPELHTLRDDPMHYPEADTLRGYLHEYTEVRVCGEEVEIDFTTPLEALRHLRLTGVTGSGAHAGTAGLRRFASEYPQNARGRYSLTFRPLYLLARKAP